MSSGQNNEGNLWAIEVRNLDEEQHRIAVTFLSEFIADQTIEIVSIPQGSHIKTREELEKQFNTEYLDKTVIAGIPTYVATYYGYEKYTKVNSDASYGARKSAWISLSEHMLNFHDRHSGVSESGCCTIRPRFGYDLSHITDDREETILSRVLVGVTPDSLSENAGLLTSLSRGTASRRKIYPSHADLLSGFIIGISR
jgi:hypothetical protein